MTAYQRKFGKKDVLALAEFGECIQYMPLGINKQEEHTKRLRKAEPRLQIGVFLGVERDSGEYRVGTESGSAVKAVTIRRLPVTHQWQRDRVERITAYPWQPGWGSKGRWPSPC